MIISSLQRSSLLVLLDEPDQVQLTATSLKPVSGSSVTLTCTARASPSASFRFFSINGSSEIVQDSASANYTISPLDYKKYNNYTASYGCMAYNSFGSSSMQTVVLEILGNDMFSSEFSWRTIHLYLNCICYL